MLETTPLFSATPPSCLFVQASPRTPCKFSEHVSCESDRRKLMHLLLSNFGQRYVQLNSTAVYNEDDGTATLAVSQMPANPNILAPGPALIFVVVDGVPSIGQWVTVGNGKIGDQPTSAVAELPASSGFKARAKSDDAKASDGGQKNNKDSDKSPASRSTTVSFTLLGATSMVGLVLALLA